MCFSADLGSVGRIKTKSTKKNQRKRIGVWYPSIIVVEPGNNIALQKINKDTQPEPCYEKLLQCSFFRFLSNLENCEHLKDFRNVDCVLVSHIKVQDTQANLKTTNLLPLLFAV